VKSAAAGSDSIYRHKCAKRQLRSRAKYLLDPRRNERCFHPSCDDVMAARPASRRPRPRLFTWSRSRRRRPRGVASAAAQAALQDGAVDYTPPARGLPSLRARIRPHYLPAILMASGQFRRVLVPTGSSGVSSWRFFRCRAGDRSGHLPGPIRPYRHNPDCASAASRTDRDLRSKPPPDADRILLCLRIARRAAERCAGSAARQFRPNLMSREALTS